jgi:cobalt/nickel transport system permease protein
VAGFAVTAALVAGVLSWFASPRPDGLEWSLANAAGAAQISAPRGGVHERLADLQSRIAVMADYDLAAPAPKAEGESAWPDVKAGKSFAGLLGAFVTLLLVAAAAFILRRRR